MARPLHRRCYAPAALWRSSTVRHCFSRCRVGLDQEAAGAAGRVEDRLTQLGVGHLYETMLREMRDAAGDNGEFYTRARSSFMVEVTDPSWARRSSTRPAAPAASWSRPTSTSRSRPDRRGPRALQDRSIFGVEEKPLPYLLGQMNLLLHGLEYAQHRPRQQPAQPAH